MGDAKVGDVLLFRPREDDNVGKGIAFATCGEYCHSARYLGNNKIIEATNGTVRPGVDLRIMTAADWDLCDAYYSELITKEEIGSILMWEISKLGCKYDTVALAPGWVHSVLGAIFKNKEYQKQAPLFNDPNSYFCSELQASAYFAILGFEICFNIHHKSVNPNDLAYRSFLVKR